MFHAMRAILLGLLMTITTPLWAEGGGAAEPIKIPLTTTAYPSEVYYLPQLSWAGSTIDFSMSAHSPTAVFTLGEIVYITKAETSPQQPEYGGRLSLNKLLIITPTQELNFDLNANRAELTLDGGRKYFLTGRFWCTESRDSTPKNPIYVASGWLRPGGLQTGTIGQTPIAIFDSNFDTVYTLSEDGIVIGSPTGKYRIVQPLSKYITTPDGIFEVQHLAKDGSEIILLPYTGPTATIEVITPQQFASQILLISSDAKLYVTAYGKAGVERESVTVIPGTYRVENTWLEATPKGSTGLTQPGAIPPLKVEAGEKQTLVLSGPKTLEFQAKRIGRKINIDPDTFHIKGQNGETYWGEYDQYRPPEVYLNVDGQSVLLGKMEFT
ncbi:MAG: hypothetical protein FWD53_08640 [Phycisphaerales bacterium]|nr:hypothetical protein [Phycisphaerales bacterium]